MPGDPTWLVTWPICCIKIARDTESPQCNTHVRFRYLPLHAQFNIDLIVFGLSVSRVAVCVYEMPKKLSRSVHDTQNNSNTWFWTSKTTKSRISFGFSQRMPTPSLSPQICSRANEWIISAKQFIDDAIRSGGRVLVHCNGTPLLRHRFNWWQEVLMFLTPRVRWYKLVPCLCCYVRYATLSTFLGGRSSYGAKSSVLYIPEWRIPHADQGTVHLFDIFPDSPLIQASSGLVGV